MKCLPTWNIKYQVIKSFSEASLQLYCTLKIPCHSSFRQNYKSSKVARFNFKYFPVVIILHILCFRISMVQSGARSHRVIEQGKFNTNNVGLTTWVRNIRTQEDQIRGHHIQGRKESGRGPQAPVPKAGIRLHWRRRGCVLLDDREVHRSEFRGNQPSGCWREMVCREVLPCRTHWASANGGGTVWTTIWREAAHGWVPCASK